MSIPGDAPSETLSDCRSSRLDGSPGMVIPNEGIIGIAPGFPEEVAVVGAWVGDEGNVEVVEVVEVGTEVPETLLRDKGTVDVVEVGTEIPCVEVRGRPEGPRSVCDPTLGKTSAPLDPLDERSTSPRLMNVAIRMTTTART
jgi:hypothetical protein